MIGLFDDRDYRDRDYAAAADWVAELTHGAVTELPPGIHSANFCPMACALNDALHADAWDPERFYGDADERMRYTEGIGGSSYLVSVDAARVVWPFDYAKSVYDFAGPDVDDLDAALDAANLKGYDFADDDPESVVPVADVPDDCFAAGGMVDEFIRRFDAGEFPSLLLDCQED